jgi:hypothetical protein
LTELVDNELSFIDLFRFAFIHVLAPSGRGASSERSDSEHLEVARSEDHFVGAIRSLHRNDLNGRRATGHLCIINKKNLYICDSIIRMGRVIGIVNVVPSLRPAKLEVEDVDGDQR